MYTLTSIILPSSLFLDPVSPRKTSLYPSGPAGFEAVFDMCALTKWWGVSTLFPFVLSSTEVLPFQRSNFSNITRKSDAMTLITPQTEVRGWRTPLTGNPLSQSIKSRTYH